jgi:hypothetical protein
VGTVYTLEVKIKKGDKTKPYLLYPDLMGYSHNAKAALHRG